MSDAELASINADADEIGAMKSISRQDSDESEVELIITGYFRDIEFILDEELPMDVIVLVMLYF